MGSYTKGILGPFRGKVGTVIGYSWRGKDLMRSLPKASTSDATEKQLVQRAKFRTVIGFLMPIAAVVGRYFGKQQHSKSPFNEATGYHLKHALLEGPDNTYLIDYPKVLISRGPLRGMADVQVTAGDPGELNLTWLDNSEQGSASATDVLVAVVFCIELAQFQMFETAITRADGAAVLTMPSFSTGSEAEVWATFVTVDNNLAATSSYVGTVTVP